jgi:hypothetical protein
VLLTIAVCWIASSYALAVVLAVDQLRRPLPAWAAIGSSRRYWVSLTLVLGFHGLGPYAAAAYLGAVRPRLRNPERARTRWDLGRLSEGIRRRTDALRMARAARAGAAQQFASVAALLVLISAVIHAAVIADHFEDYWLFGVFFAVVACLQAVWTGLIYAGRLTRRVLLAGAIGNAALAALWAISRTIGVPLGPHPWQAEAVGEVDVLSTLDEVAAVILVAAAMGCLRSNRRTMTSPYLRLVALTGPLFIYSFMAAFGAGGPHHH